MSQRHVMPTSDLVEHENDTEGDCVCGPHSRFVEGGVVYVHHSLDERELAEKGRTAPREA